MSTSGPPSWASRPVPCKVTLGLERAGKADGSLAKAGALPPRLLPVVLGPTHMVFVCCVGGVGGMSVSLWGVG